MSIDDDVLPICIESIDQKGRGVGRFSGKTVFVDGAITSEQVLYTTVRKRKSYDDARCHKLETISPYRRDPRCPHFGVCGGCSMQHMSSSLQVASKQLMVEQTLMRVGKVKPLRISTPVYGPDWFYRNRASLSVRFVEKKGRVVVGFREKNGRYVTDMGSCCVLADPMSRLVPLLPALVHSLDSYRSVPVIEVAIGHDLVALVFRCLVPLSEKDRSILLNFSRDHGVQVWVQQEKSLESTFLLDSTDLRPLFYRLPEFNLDIRFLPYEFTQVNHAMNSVLVRLVMRYMDVAPTDRVLDLFCGLGNFTLPIARLGADVVGIEGNEQLVRQARSNADLNGLTDRAKFFSFDLYKNSPQEIFDRVGAFNKILLDPPRSGSIEICQQLPTNLPQRIVYVSCHPASMARDAGVLVHNHNYVMSELMVLNMFPQTSHVEVLSVFDLKA
ncbi:23S rRNA (uracil(1939)-C(5))-methyltransferase RlmD [Candidatus Ichthyocystis hellenicum]|uniref:23S rRNA (uracil(1939)-C(5))-methyltransferase RlmD n=1 Tax=Candidatus Ichthyocystis hellenicum TaxID=1561003 RepID=UPI000AD83692|nr:23S rRNA (uracil(1939)-C(5))-methyltransferase RlmD [Candidatus Ichthyocystis hellenicum]